MVSERFRECTTALRLQLLASSSKAAMLLTDFRVHLPVSIIPLALTPGVDSLKHCPQTDHMGPLSICGWQ